MIFYHITKNGFAALADLDDNGDRQVNAQDDAWKDLLIWQDVNQDGISQSGELTAITEAHIAALLTIFEEASGGKPTVSAIRDMKFF